MTEKMVKLTHKLVQIVYAGERLNQNSQSPDGLTVKCFLALDDHGMPWHFETWTDTDGDLRCDDPIPCVEATDLKLPKSLLDELPGAEYE